MERQLGRAHERDVIEIRTLEANQSRDEKVKYEDKDGNTRFNLHFLSIYDK